MPSGSTAKALIIRTGGKKINYSVTKQRMSVGHYPNAPRLDPVDYLRQAGREAGAPDQECLLDARGREWSRWEAREIDGPVTQAKPRPGFPTREGGSFGQKANQTTRVSLRPVWVLQQKLERS